MQVEEKISKDKKTKYIKIKDEYLIFTKRASGNWDQMMGTNRRQIAEEIVK